MDFNRLLFVNQQFLVIMWVLSVVLLGMGGIVREKAIGTSSVTLALPVSRARLLRVRIAMGAFEAIVLGVVPWLAVFVVSSIARKPILIIQVASYVLLLVAGGLVYFAMAVLVSSLVSGEYTAPALAFGIVLLAAMLFDAWLRQFNLWRFLTGDFSIDRSTCLLSGTFTSDGHTFQFVCCCTDPAGIDHGRAETRVLKSSRCRPNCPSREINPVLLVQCISDSPITLSIAPRVTGDSDLAVVALF